MNKILTVYKAHIAEHFISGSVKLDAGVGKGGTVFLNYNTMLERLWDDSRGWYYACITVKPDDILIDPEYPYMAEMLCDVPATYSPLIRNSVKDVVPGKYAGIIKMLQKEANDLRENHPRTRMGILRAIDLIKEYRE